jgi:flagellar basal body P-ring formation protein FlgA
MRRALLAFLLLAPAAEAAIPRMHAVVEAEQIRLGDLFDDIGLRGATLVGPAPPPGSRIVVEAAQLATIARLGGLAWRPTGEERVVIERPGRAIGREELLEALRVALTREGMDPEDEIDLPGLALPMVPAGARVALHAEQASLDATTQRFAATLVIAPEGSAVQRLRLTGRTLPTQPVIVATRRIAAGELVQPGDLRVARWRTERVRPGLATDPALVEGQRLRRAITAEAAFATADLAQPAVIERNQAVTILLEAPGLSMTAQGRALEAAPRGAIVPVMNLASRQVVEAIAVAPGRVRVAIGSTPVARIPEGQTPTAAIAARAAQR